MATSTPTPRSSSTDLSQEVDSLLEHYLHLLDQYAALRSSLTKVQSSIHQNIARANFSADRGIRYGADFYDERMRATRVCCVTLPSGFPDVPEKITGTTSSAGIRLDAAAGTGTGAGALQSARVTVVATADIHKEELPPKEGLDQDPNATTTSDEHGDAYANVNAEASADGIGNGNKSGDKTKTSPGTKTITKTDPIRMFGILTPPALKLAQADAVKMVEEIIPKLVSVTAEMKELEIRIRRAKKYRVKAEAAESGRVKSGTDGISGMNGAKEKLIGK